MSSYHYLSLHKIVLFGLLFFRIGIENTCHGLSSTNKSKHSKHSDSTFPNIKALSNHKLSRASFVTSVASAFVASPRTTNALTYSESKSERATVPLSVSDSSIQESISGFIAGAALAATKTIVKFPLDTATVRLQIRDSDYSIRDIFRLLDGSYNGITLSLLSNIPAGAVFFAFKDATKASLKASALSDAPKWLTTSIAVAVAQVPYWVVRNPSEVIKVRQQAGIEGYGEGVSAFDAIQQTLQNSNTTETTRDGFREFYTGYWENIAYSYPADVIKFVAYEALTKGRKDLSPVEGAKAGALATALAQFVTTPLDVIRNRLMTGKDQKGATMSIDEPNIGYLESLVRLAREEGAGGLFAGANPRVSKAIVSGAFQFATYEKTKQSIKGLLSR